MDDKTPVLFKLAHISDLHFSKLSFSFKELFTKSLVGNLNLFLKRRYLYKNETPFSLIEQLKKLQTSHVLITGDLSTTSSLQEFEKANEFIKALEKEHMHVLVIPGNHDSYTKAAFSDKRFFQYFENSLDGFLNYSLKEDKLCAHPLGEDFWIIRIDTTHKTPVYLSTGAYTKSHDDKLKNLLDAIPQNANVIIMNHFPLFDQEHPRRKMHGSALLRKTLSHYKQVKLYLHGHTHKQLVGDFRKNSLPIIADSGSLSHIKQSSWNFLELTPSSCHISLYKQDGMKTWTSSKNLTYSWSYE